MDVNVLGTTNKYLLMSIFALILVFTLCVYNLHFMIIYI